MGSDTTEFQLWRKIERLRRWLVVLSGANALALGLGTGAAVAAWRAPLAAPVATTAVPEESLVKAGEIAKLPRYLTVEWLSVVDPEGRVLITAGVVGGRPQIALYEPGDDSPRATFEIADVHVLAKMYRMGRDAGPQRFWESRPRLAVFSSSPGDCEAHFDKDGIVTDTEAYARGRRRE